MPTSSIARCSGREAVHEAEAELPEDVAHACTRSCTQPPTMLRIQSVKRSNGGTPRGSET